jgi:hypothetical protein
MHGCVLPLFPLEPLYCLTPGRRDLCIQLSRHKIKESLGWRLADPGPAPAGLAFVPELFPVDLPDVLGHKDESKDHPQKMVSAAIDQLL